MVSVSSGGNSLSKLGGKCTGRFVKERRAKCRDGQLAILSDSDLASKETSELSPILWPDSPLGLRLLIGFLLFLFGWVFSEYISLQFLSSCGGS